MQMSDGVFREFLESFKTVTVVESAEDKCVPRHKFLILFSSPFFVRVAGMLPLWAPFFQGVVWVTEAVRDVLSICSRSVVMQSETFLKNPAGKISRQQKEDFKCCIMSCRFLSLIGSNCVMVLKLVLDGQLTTHLLYLVQWNWLLV